MEEGDNLSLTTDVRKISKKNDWQGVVLDIRKEINFTHFLCKTYHNPKWKTYR